MNLTTVKPGDLIRADIRGVVFLAEVTERERGAVLIRPVPAGVNYGRAKAREVVAHWRKSKASVR